MFGSVGLHMMYTLQFLEIKKTVWLERFLKVLLRISLFNYAVNRIFN